MKLALIMIIPLTICLLLSSQCKTSSDSQNTVNQLFNEVMDLHDEVMPKMSDLHYLKKEINAVLETGSLSDSQVQEANEFTTRLEGADEQMMDWMAAFSKPKKEADTEIALAYLRAEQEKMQHIKQMTWDVIAQAEKWLEKNK